MAYFGFTNKLRAGDTIQIFNYGNCKRDFTYVDDIVEGVKRVMQAAPEKKNGEDIFCHGYFSPKEVRFLQMLMKTAPEEIQCYHWGDMDYGGIQIFLYNEKNIFPNLIPWKMDVPSYKAALEKEKGIKLCSKKQKKLEALNAGKLEVLKQCILENKMEIEQEMLI